MVAVNGITPVEAITGVSGKQDGEQRPVSLALLVSRVRLLPEPPLARGSAYQLPSSHTGSEWGLFRSESCDLGRSEPCLDSAIGV